MMTMTMTSMMMTVIMMVVMMVMTLLTMTMMMTTTVAMMMRVYGEGDDDDDESDDDGGAPTLTSPMFPSLSVCVPPHLHLLLCSSPPLPAPRFFFLFFPISSPFFL